MTLLLGDSLERLKELPADSVDACVCDPPYGLSFMNKHWDYDVPSVELWREVLRVLKPGAHLLSFGGTRTYHRMVVAIEDAGFEIRDQIMWIYGSGFPKSMNIGKAIDKQNGIALEVVGKGRSGSSSRAYQSEEKTTAGHYEQTQSTNEWSGWGTALKPANEPIVLARKPLEAKLTVAANVLKHGTGAINVNASRIGPPQNTKVKFASNADAKKTMGAFEEWDGTYREQTQGRWPANVLFDEEAAAVLDEQSGILKTNSTGKGNPTGKASSKINVGGGRTPAGIPTSVGGASRFFLNVKPDASDDITRFIYCAKASKRERFMHLTCGCEVANQSAWLKPDQNLSEQTGFTSPAKATSERISTENSSLGTSSHGNLQTVPCPLVCKSTTSTETIKTTGSKTYSSSPQRSTSDFIQDASLPMASGSSPAQSAECLSPSTQKIGTSPEKAGRSMGVAVHATLAESLKKSVCAVCGESPKSEGHPTQKPIRLMEYLVRMITPPGGTVLDPFLGSGSTLVAAARLGFKGIGCEMSPEYLEIARRRIEHAQKEITQSELPLEGA